MMKYSNDLEGYIKNMRDIEEKASANDERGLLMMASYARKTAEEFLKQGKESFLDVINLRSCVDDSEGVFPSQLSKSGVMFWNGTKITIDEFRNECKRQGYRFRVK